jgi:Bacterial Ig-like domain (group 2)
MRIVRRLNLATAVAVFGVLAGCEERRNQGTRLPVRAPLSPSTDSSVSQLTIEGPDAVPPAGTAQFTAIARYSDGATRDVTTEAAWVSSNESVVRMSSNGLATAVARGDVSISAVFARRTAVRSEIMVLPPGTFRLIGSVRDFGVPVSGSRVTVVSGEGAGLAVNTSNGSYRLYGVAGDIEVQATADGYDDAAKRVRVSSHQTLDFDLTPSVARESVAGDYTLTITAGPACTDLPLDLRVRTYRAGIEQAGPSVTVTLSGAQFRDTPKGRQNRFGGIVQPGRIIFRIASASDYYLGDISDVVEQLPASTLQYLTIVGDVTVTGSHERRSGLLNGVITTLDSRLVRTSTCRAENHRFELRR